MKTAIVLLGLLAFASAECPNACSGHGTCGPKDYCTCYKNYQASDCSQRTCPFGHAHVDTPKGDLNAGGDALTDGSTTVLVDSTVYPLGTTEKFPDSQNHEAHFYMECSNKGLCDRKTGECDCLEGYEGTACQRASCPNDCSGHGTCESIKELAEMGPDNYRLSQATTANGATTYALWDEHIGMGCKCDPQYFGADCSQRYCKHGVDPLYESVGTEVLEEVVITADVTATAGATGVHVSTALSGDIELRFYDVFNEDYVTKPIAISTGCTGIKAKLEALPNSVIKTVTCSQNNYGAGSGVVPAGTGQKYSVRFDTNPGVLKTLEVVSSSATATIDAVTDGTATVSVGVAPTTRQGEFTDRYTTVASVTASSVSGTTLTVSGADPADIGALEMIKINDHHLLVDSITGTSVTLAYAYSGPAVGSGTPIYISSDTATASSHTIASIDVGGNTLTVDSAPADGTLARGTIVYFEDQRFVVQKKASDAITLDRAFGGTRAGAEEGADMDSAFVGISGATDALYVITEGANSFTYSSQCSNRGSCDHDSGLCQCYRGYKGDNCDTQSALAV